MKTFDELGVMIDCSRNAVMTPDAVRDYMRILSKMGYTYVMLYTEDTYEVEDEPYFGYFRGRYTVEELKALDAYALSLGIELIPCVQALAHVNAIMRWEPYHQVRDCNDILLIGEERTYELIEHMFATLRRAFHTRRIHLGMDEAWMVGLGRYREINGIRSRFDVLMEHLTRVCRLAEKYDFAPMLWNDMFYHLAKESGKAETAKAAMPANVTLVYWDYYRTSEEEYARLMRENKAICDNVIFAGGAWCWHGFAPHNAFSIKATRAAFTSCAREGIRSAFLTLWGDDGAECSRYAVLPTLAWGACLARDPEATEEDVRTLFRECVGGEYDDFLLLDLPDRPSASSEKWDNPCKYLLYSDPFAGYLDYTVPRGAGTYYADLAARLEEAAVRETAYAHVFCNLAALCHTLAVKAELGSRTRKAYQSGDKAEAARLAREVYPEVLRRLEAFAGAFWTAWEKENKPGGFDVQDLRIGGLKERLSKCATRLSDWADGKIDAIPELAEKILPWVSHRGEGETVAFNTWAYNSTVNVISHNCK